MRLLLILLYPTLLKARCWNALLGRDPLRLRRPKGDSYWIERGAQPDRGSYFSESSVAEGHGQGGMGALAAVVLRLVACCFAPRRPQPGETYSPAVDREEGIPDEVYTLW